MYGHGAINKGILPSEQYKNSRPYSQVYDDPKYKALVAAEQMPTGGQGPGWSAPKGVTTLEQLQAHPDAYNSWVGALSNINHLTPAQQAAAGRRGGPAGSTPGTAPWEIQSKAYQDALAWGVSNGILPRTDKWSFGDFAPFLMFAGPAYAAMAGAAGAAGAGAGMGASPGAGTTFGASGLAAPTSSSAFGGMGTGTMSTAGGMGAMTNPALSGASGGALATGNVGGMIGGIQTAMPGIPVYEGAAVGAAGSMPYLNFNSPGVNYAAGANPGAGVPTDFGGPATYGDYSNLMQPGTGGGTGLQMGGGLGLQTSGGLGLQAGGMTAGAGAGSGAINWANLAQIAKDWGPVVWGGIEYLNAKDAADAYRQSLERQLEAADPFGPERAQYQRMLQEHMTDPMKFLSSPQVQFASDAAARKMASMGYNMSGNQAQAIADASMGEYWKQAETLSNLAGAGISPNAGAIQSGVLSNINARMGERGAMGNLARSVLDAIGLDAGQRSGEKRSSGAGNQTAQTIGERSFGYLDTLLD